MRTGLWICSGAALLGLAACGSSETSSSSASSSASSTTTAASTSSSGAAVALAALYNGHYTGTWTNQTFGSTGSIVADVQIDPSSGMVTVKLTLGGNVFGAAAPGPLTFTGQIPASGTGTIQGTNDFFGPYSASVKPEGSFTVTCPNVPGGRVKTFSETGSLSVKGVDVTYTVTLADGSTAHGVASATKG